MRKTTKAIAAVSAAAVLALAACAGQSTTVGPPQRPASSLHALARATPFPITHIVIVFQENRTPDYLFQGMASHGADIASSAIDSEGQTVPLHHVSLAAAYDLGHGHASFLRDCDFNASGTCQMDGFDAGMQPIYHLRPFGFAPLWQAQPYLDMAEQYVFADRMFQSNQAGSFPAHQYIVSGTANAEPTTQDNVASDPYSSKNGHHLPAGCDAPPAAVVGTIDPTDGQPGPTPFPCFDRPVLGDLLDGKAVTWRYYQRQLGAGLWHALDAVSHVRYGPDYANVVSPPEKILSDISNGRLRKVSWVMPSDAQHSDHSGSKGAGGPSWVAAIVNKLGGSKYWNHVAIFVTWDDWGGWYDHVPPPQMGNYYELGFRVPLIVISPYAKVAYVSHTQYEFGSILAFAEETYGIPKGSLGTTDVRANDLMDAFDFSQSPRPYVQISAPPFVPTKRSALEADAEDP